MMLGKRPRPPIKRTTSMTEFTLDHNHTTAVDVFAGANNNLPSPPPPYDHANNNSNNPFNINPRPDATTTTTTLDHRLLTATVISPRNHRRNSMGSPHFLTACHLCRRRLITGHDIFMYRGDRAFCSFECRQQQMNQDEKKDGRSTLISKKAETVNIEYSSNTSKID